MDNTEWTNGFWTGELWLAYEYSQQDAFKNIAHKNVLSFLDRVNKRVELAHHDLGFLYTPSCMAEYKINEDGEAREAALKAADKLIERYQEKRWFYSSLGRLGQERALPFDYRLLAQYPTLILCLSRNRRSKILRYCRKPFLCFS